MPYFAMARKLRIQYEGAIYHVMNRGDHREDIFRGDKHSKLFIETLGQACAKTDWQIHAWCLMSNHCQRGVKPSHQWANQNQPF